MRIEELWRYPVKSMAGETMDKTTIEPSGVPGDRRLAVVDAKSGVALSAKRHGVLLRCLARLADEGVTITLPDGEELPASAPETSRRLTELLGRSVRIASPETTAGRLEFPEDIEGGTGEAVKVVETGGATFHDSDPVHLITRSTLETLADGDSGFDRRRFRPNIVVSGAPAGLPEHDWVGGRIIIGSIEAEVVGHCRRCVMVTREQQGLERDRSALEAARDLNDTRAGVYLRPRERGLVAVGDTVGLLAKDADSPNC